MEKISVVVPCYNEEDVLELFNVEMEKLRKELKNVTLEVIYINDGSADNTLNILRELAKKDKNNKYISFSKNFGKESGIYAGLKNATGDYVVVIDADLQHNPRTIIDMYNILKEKEYDSVAVRRVDRKGEKKIISFFSRIFYKVIKAISQIEVVDGEMDFRMMNKKMYKAVLKLSETNRFSKGIFSWVGFNTKWLEQENIERAAGTTKWSFWKLVTYSMSGITAFSTMPLIISSVIGLIFCLLSFILVIYVVIKTIIVGVLTPGWASTVCIIFLTSGVQLFCIGILGQYLGKTYIESKNRPLYITKESNIDEENN
ncbi:MAG: glycosyltransferase family 2 protein [Bacillales bacterium]|nr:glycosyltransferase family 2 protein [Bacillales bacterium]